VKRRVYILLIAFTAFSIAAFVLRRVPVPADAPVASAVAASSGSLHEIRLASRTIDLANPQPVADVPPENLSVRGTCAWAMQADVPVSSFLRAHAEARGARVIAYAPVNALIVEASPETVRALVASSVFRAAVPFGPVEKGAPGLGPGPVTVVPLAEEDRAALLANLAAAGIAVDTTGLSHRGSFHAVVSAEELELLLARGDVRWIEHWERPRFSNDVAAGVQGMNVDIVRDVHGLTGTGQFITTSDSGIDTGNLATMHPDLTNTVVGFRTAYSNCSATDINGHGTHTAGSIAGSGVCSEGRFRGIAPGAKLWAWFCYGKDGYVYTPSVANGLFRPEGVAFTSYVHSASWGSAVNGRYDAQCAGIDDYIWNHPDFLPVFSAGNEGDDPKGNYYVPYTIDSPASAKNVLAVGATENLRPDLGYYSDNTAQIAYFSSCGPCVDGRIKPDIVAPGTYIVSARSSQAAETAWGVYPENDRYLYNGGTSMATPLTAGAVALVREWLTTRRGFTNAPPTAALIKAVLMGGATDLCGESGNNALAQVPDTRQGWGRVNVGESVYPTNRAVRLIDRIPFAQSYEFVYALELTNAAPFDVQLCWIDYPADVSAKSAIVNDLDLVVSNATTGAQWYGNRIAGGDHTNTAESVHVSSAEAGSWYVTVRGVTVPYDSTEGGAAALYVRGAFAAEDDVATNEQETVEIVIGTSGGGLYKYCSPEGTNRVLKGSTVTFSAEIDAWDVGRNNTASAHYPLTGFTGTGCVPASDSTNIVTFAATADGTLTWCWTETPDLVNLWRSGYLLEEGAYVLKPEARNTWVPYGEPVTISPADGPFGGADYAVTPDNFLYRGLYQNYWGKYRYGNFYFEEPDTLKFVCFAVGATDETAYFVYGPSNACYRSPATVTLPMTNGTDVLDVYALASSPMSYVSTNAALQYASCWWFCRNLMGLADSGEGTEADIGPDGDPDGDGFPNVTEYQSDTDPTDWGSFPFMLGRFTGPELTFMGSKRGSFVLERSLTFGGAWEDVWTNAVPRASITNHLVTAPYMPGGGFVFFRVRHERHEEDAP